MFKQLVKWILHPLTPLSNIAYVEDRQLCNGSSGPLQRLRHATEMGHGVKQKSTKSKHRSIFGSVA